MRILIIDSSSESQANIASRIRLLNSEELDSMDVSVQLAHPGKFESKLKEADVLVLGPELGDLAHQVSLKAKEFDPELAIVRFVYQREYSEGAFRSSFQSRVRKVLSVDAPDLDILQELVNVYEDLCEKGKKLRGKSIVVSQAKGGVGATTIAAALAEACAQHGGRTLVWDFDIESRDISRALSRPAFNNSVLREILEGKRELERQSLRDACISVDERLDLLAPPDSMAASMDLVGNPECLGLVQRMFQLAGAMHENVIVDTAGRFSPATCALMLTADINLIVIDDSMLGISAVDPVVRYMLSIIPDHSSVRFLCSGTALGHEEIMESLEGMMDQSYEETWSLPGIPFDKAAQNWPIQDGTLYRSGSAAMREAIDQIVLQLGMADRQTGKSRQTNRRSVAQHSRFLRPFLFQKAGNA